MAITPRMMPAMAVPRNACPRLEMIAKQIAPTPQMIATECETAERQDREDTADQGHRCE